MHVCVCILEEAGRIIMGEAGIKLSLKYTTRYFFGHKKHDLKYIYITRDNVM